MAWLNRLVERLLGYAPEPAHRLSREAALSLARTEVSRDGALDPATLQTTQVIEREGRTVWLVATPTVGSGTCVVVDDATGDILGIEFWGKR